METARGRWFLAEHARRNRHAETEQLRALLEQVRRAVQKSKPSTTGPRVAARFMDVLRLRVGAPLLDAVQDKATPNEGDFSEQTLQNMSRSTIQALWRRLLRVVSARSGLLRRDEMEGVPAPRVPPS